MDIDDRPCPSVSVVIPAFNSASTIERALESVERQSVPPLEVIVVDDGSSDGTADKIRIYAETMTVPVRVHVQRNRGAGAARNRALADCRGEFVAFLDADDEWLADKLKTCLARLMRGDIALVAHNGWIVDGSVESEVDIAQRFRAAAADPLHGLYRRGYISTSSVVARLEAVLSAGGFDDSLRTGQDFDLWLNMAFSPTARFEVLGDYLTRYHISPSGITAQTERRLADTLKIALRHAPALRRRTGRFLASLWFRIFALHREAFLGYWRKGQHWNAVRTAMLAPVRLGSLTLRAIISNGRDD